MGKASDKRLGMVSSLILRTLDEVIREELRDPRLGLYTITGIRLAKDLASAVIKVSTLGDPAQVTACCKVLNAAAPLLWNRLRGATDLRTVPKLHFEPDLSGVYAAEIDSLIRELPPPAEQTPGESALELIGSETDDEEGQP